MLKALVPIYSLSDLKHVYNYMCFKAFYSGLNNIHVILLVNFFYDYIFLICLGFVEIERKASKEEIKQSKETKPAPKH